MDNRRSEGGAESGGEQERKADAAKRAKASNFLFFKSKPARGLRVKGKMQNRNFCVIYDLLRNIH